MKTFKFLCEAVEQNNKMNDSKWSDWQDIASIEDVYGPLESDYIEVARCFLKALIRDNGRNVWVYVDAMHCLTWGYTK